MPSRFKLGLHRVFYRVYIGNRSVHIEGQGISKKKGRNVIEGQGTSKKNDDVKEKCYT